MMEGEETWREERHDGGGRRHNHNGRGDVMERGGRHDGGGGDMMEGEEI